MERLVIDLEDTSMLGLLRGLAPGAEVTLDGEKFYVDRVVPITGGGADVHLAAKPGGPFVKVYRRTP